MHEMIIFDDNSYSYISKIILIRVSVRKYLIKFYRKIQLYINNNNDTLFELHCVIQCRVIVL